MIDAIPQDLLYHPEHTWARVDGDTATLGITHHAQDLLGEIVFWEAPVVGDLVTAGEAFTELESMKATSDVFAPLSGEITAVNAAVAHDPAIINDDPYGVGWLVRIAASDLAETKSLFGAQRYAAVTRE